MGCIIYCIGGHAEWTRTTVPPISSSATLGQPSYYTFIFIFVIISIIICLVWFGQLLFYVFVFAIIIIQHIHHQINIRVLECFMMVCPREAGLEYKTLAHNHVNLLLFSSKKRGTYTSVCLTTIQL